MNYLMTGSVTDMLNGSVTDMMGIDFGRINIWGWLAIAAIVIGIAIYARHVLKSNKKEDKE